MFIMHNAVKGHIETIQRVFETAPLELRRRLMDACRPRRKGKLALPDLTAVREAVNALPDEDARTTCHACLEACRHAVRDHVAIRLADALPAARRLKAAGTDGPGPVAARISVLSAEMQDPAVGPDELMADTVAFGKYLYGLDPACFEGFGDLEKSSFRGCAAYSASCLCALTGQDPDGPSGI